jgi:hypothetical protein
MIHLSLSDVEEKAEFLFNKLKGNNTEKTNIELVLIAYIGASCIVEGISPEEQRALVMKYLMKLETPSK